MSKPDNAIEICCDSLRDWMKTIGVSLLNSTAEGSLERQTIEALILGIGAGIRSAEEVSGLCYLCDRATEMFYSLGMGSREIAAELGLAESQVCKLIDGEPQAQAAIQKALRGIAAKDTDNNSDEVLYG